MSKLLTDKAVRKENDNYPTPGWVIETLKRRIPGMFYSILDPCAGDGAILERGIGTRYGMEIEEEHRSNLEQAAKTVQGGRVKICDALDVDWTADWPWWSGVVMNPPFCLASEFVRKALTYKKPVAALLRLSFLEPCKDRFDLLRLNPWIGVLSKRPKFRADKKGSDSSTCAWFVWSTNGTGWEILL